LRDIIDMKILT